MTSQSAPPLEAQVAFMGDLLDASNASLKAAQQENKELLAVNELLRTELFAARNEIATWRKAEHDLSGAYLRLRSLIPNAYNTPHAPSHKVVWQHTEDCLKVELARLNAHLLLAQRQHYRAANYISRSGLWDKFVEWDDANPANPRPDAPSSSPKLTDAERAALEECIYGNRQHDASGA